MSHTDIVDESLIQSSTILFVVRQIAIEMLHVGLMKISLFDVVALSKSLAYEWEG